MISMFITHHSFGVLVRHVGGGAGVRLDLGIKTAAHDHSYDLPDHTPGFAVVTDIQVDLQVRFRESKCCRIVCRRRTAVSENSIRFRRCSASFRVWAYGRSGCGEQSSVHAPDQTPRRTPPWCRIQIVAHENYLFGVGIPPLEDESHFHGPVDSRFGHPDSRLATTH